MPNRKTLTFVFRMTLVLLLAGCSRVPPAPPPTATTLPTASETAVPTATLTRTPIPTRTATPTLTPTITLTPTPRWLALAGTPLPPGLQVISMANAGVVSALATWKEPEVTDLAWTPHEELLAVATSKEIRLYDPATRQRLRSLYAEEGLVAIDFSPDGSWLAAGSRQGEEQFGYFSSLQLWRGPDWKPMGSLYGEARGVTNLAFAPLGTTFAASFSGLEPAKNSTVEFWNSVTWEITRTLTTGTALNLAFSPDGRLLATVPDRYATRIWQMRTGEQFQQMHTSFTGAVNSLAFSPDGSVLATGHYDGTILIWDVAKGEALLTMETEGVVESLAFSPDGTLLASGTSYPRHAVQLWSAASGELLRTLPGHTHAVDNLVFSPDGDLLVSASYDGTVRLWGLRP